MPIGIDLDAPIYAIPCGVPGDLNALSGRAHICPGRVELGMTTCVDDGTACQLCAPYDTPNAFDVRISGVELCSCSWMGTPPLPSGYWKTEILDGALNGEWRLWRQHSPSPCQWFHEIGHVRLKQYRDEGCGDLVKVWEPVVLQLALDVSPSSWYIRIVGPGPAVGYFWDVLPNEGAVSCLEVKTFHNEYICAPYWDPLAGGATGGSARCVPYFG